MNQRSRGVALSVCLLGLSLGSRAQNAPSAPTQNPPAVSAAQEALPPPPALPSAVPSAQQITLAQALQQAERSNPQNLAGSHQIAGAKANLSGQSAPVNPVANLIGLTNTPEFFDTYDPTRYGVLFTLETSGRQRLRTHQARAQLQQTRADVETTHINVREATAAAYIDLQVANRTLEDERAAYDIARNLYELIEQQVKLGDAAESNAIRARIAVTQEEQNLVKAIGTVKLARANLNVQMGRLPATPVDAIEPLTYTPMHLDLEALQRIALQSRPELLSAEANRRSLEAVVGLQRSQYYPDLVVGVNPIGARSGEVEFGVTLPLFDFGSIRGQVRKAQEDVKTQTLLTEQERQTVRLDVETAYQTLLEAQLEVASFQDGILPRAQTLLTRVEQGYKLGASSILDLIDAQQTFRATHTDYNVTLGEYNKARAQLERAIGKPLP